ncbi:MAG: hypothetical protein KH299_06515 [Firmicutes bacterium]|jgi:hypothetical protein|nr:hypothetical protein [Bacillota bacterium]
MGSKRGNDNAAKRPGIFIPFSFRRTLKYLNADQKACLLDAVLTYGEDGIEPEYSGPDAVGFMVAFEQLREKIDYDGKAYVDRVRENRRNGYIPAWKAYAAKNGLSPDDMLARNEWIDLQIAKADGSIGKQTGADGSIGKQTLPKDKDKIEENKDIQETDHYKDIGSDRGRGVGEGEEPHMTDYPAPAPNRPPSALGGDYAVPPEDQWEHMRQSASDMLAGYPR